ncbi:hypothetical protein QAD02_018782 [Eretmocerus hayati]|uniref:Uncharacterized protein n=1 Tax=Eretmocerus hayati TaxID=131215 RepID=A0ACC2PHC3_9HYME|nr:hypothetical protein QAD02_018782 [Eretmocerus hayati]
MIPPQQFKDATTQSLLQRKPQSFIEYNERPLSAPTDGHFYKVMDNDIGLIGLDIAIDILGGSTQTENHFILYSEFRLKSLDPSHAFKPLPSSSAPRNLLSFSAENPRTLKPLPDLQEINQTSIGLTDSPDLFVTKPVKKLNLKAYRERNKNSTKKMWTRQDCIREYANRACLKEARDLHSPKKTSFSPICQAHPVSPKTQNQHSTRSLVHPDLRYSITI